MNAERSRRTLWTIPFLIAACCAGAWAQQDQEHRYSGGSGTESYPYKIATAADLILLGETPADYSKHFILTADIDLAPNLPGGRVFDKAVIAPDANDANGEFDGTPFSGTFDGDGHTISHLTIVGTGYLGLFGQLKSPPPRYTRHGTVEADARITDLAVADVNITGEYGCAGALAVYNDGVITGCHSSGQIKSEWSSGGGLVGVNFGTITDCYSSCMVSGGRVGGLVQQNLGTIANSHSDGSITGDWCVGGLVSDNSGRIMSSYSTSTVGGDERVGGLVGNNEGVITTSYSSGIVEWGHDGVGGLVGHNAGCIHVCWSSEKVAGHWKVGGLVGENWGSITASYATGTVDGGHEVGGLVGDGGSVAMCYSTAKVKGHEDVGGLAGYGWSAATNFWDVDVSGQPNDVGQTGLTTAQMKDINTFLNAGWDFVGETRNGTCDYWQMSPGEYPQLCWFAGNRPVMPEGQGTEEKPYLIRNARDLGTVWCEPTAHYRLVEDIDLSEIRWSMAVIPSFGGTFEGNYICGLHIEGDGYLGLFGQTDAKACISWVRLSRTEIKGTYRVGSLVGDNGGAVTNCEGYGLIRGECAVGVLVGSNHGSIARSESSGLVTGGSGVGGLAGSNDSPGTITSSHSTAMVQGYDRVGGLVGWSYGSIGSSYSDCVVAGDCAVGGLVGYAAGREDAGKETELVISCYSTSAVVGGEAVGGLIGRVESGRVKRCYSIGAVAGDDCVGGLAGSVLCGDVTECYSASAVGGRSNAGALMGDVSDATVTSCLWDSQVCPLASAAGGIGRTTAEMQQAATFLELGWDFEGETANGSEDVWTIWEGHDYPRFRGP